MKRKATILFILLIAAASASSQMHNDAINIYKKAMTHNYIFYNTLYAAKLFHAGMKEDRRYLNNYMGLFRYYVSKNNHTYAKRVLDLAYQECTLEESRKKLIVAKARFIHDELSNRPKARAFVKWAGMSYSFRRLSILKIRYNVEINKILRLANIKTSRNKVLINWRRYKNKKLCLIFYHPQIPNIKKTIYASYSLAKRYGFTPIVFCVVNKRTAYKYRDIRFGFPVICSSKTFDVSLALGIDLVPHVYFLGRYKEVLYSGHPLHISRGFLKRIGRY